MSRVARERLLLVRHAMPAIDPATPAEKWRLGPEGRAAARLLAPLVRRPAYFVASTEPKAHETLSEVAADTMVVTEAGFAEVRRPHVWSDDHDYRAAARAYLRGERPDGWEPREEAAARFEAAVVLHLAAAGDWTLVVGTHGLASTVWLSGRFGLEPEEFWAALRFPDLIEVDLATGLTSTLLQL